MDATYPLNTCTNENRQYCKYSQLRTRPSPPSPRGDEILEPNSLLFISLAYPDFSYGLSRHLFLFYFQVRATLRPRIPHGLHIASPTAT